MVVASVILPTTGDRGPLLPFAVGSVLAQSESSVQVLVVGDGLDADGCRIASDLAERHDRVEFVEFPKGVRRGEQRRDEVIRERAVGDIVTYLCDRDLYLPDHIATMRDLLADADLAYTVRFRIGSNDRPQVQAYPDLTAPAVAARALPRIPLSFAGHTRQAYLSLPEGWRTTPEGIGTDTYMWKQFLADGRCRVADTARPTVLSFKRGSHPGWPTADRLEILRQWTDRMHTDGFDEWLRTELLHAHVRALAAADPHGDGHLPSPLRRRLNDLRARRDLRRWRRRTR